MTLGAPNMEDGVFAEQLIEWRHHLHRHPETGFEEIKTSDFVAQVLGDLGLQVARGIGGTGVVASLTVGDGKGAIGLRADMDALNIAEDGADRDYASRVPGKMHACGHDGHMTMVLGAAKLLCERRDFNGTVRFIFQPAEEHGRGAKAMIAAGRAASNVAGADKVDSNIAPIMASEDFGAFLRVVPGNFAFIGNGADPSPGGTPLHNARYDFNDDILTVGARYFAEIPRLRLPV
jgi:metal-dependent amidase/aminoacylase/carboxypeptidase family protein